MNKKLSKLMTPYNVKENENIETIKKRMTSVDTTSLSLIINEDKLITNRAKNYDKYINSLFQKYVQPLLDKLNNAITQYAEKNKIDMVYIIEQLNPALAYINRKKNITSKIIPMINK